MRRTISLTLLGLAALAAVCAVPLECYAQSFSLDLGFFRRGSGASFHYNSGPAYPYVPAPPRYIVHEYEPPYHYPIYHPRPVIVEHHHHGRGRGHHHHHHHRPVVVPHRGHYHVYP